MKVHFSQIFKGFLPKIVKFCSMHTKHTIFVLFGQQKLGIIRYDECLVLRFDDLIQKWDVSTQYSFRIISFLLGITHYDIIMYSIICITYHKVGYHNVWYHNVRFFNEWYNLSSLQLTANRQLSTSRWLSTRQLSTRQLSTTTVN